MEYDVYPSFLFVIFLLSHRRRSVSFLSTSQLTIPCSGLTIETLEQGVSMALLWCLYC